MSNAELGRRGEDLAAGYLESKGYVVLDRNYRFERAEIDIVCYQPGPVPENGGDIVFVEVKARSGTGFGRPEEAVGDAKQRQIVHAARAYLYERQLEGAPCRFDVVAILDRGGAPSFEHFESAFIGFAW